jgi:glycosyltransferase involved in cell wall biosynthesis
MKQKVKIAIWHRYGPAEHTAGRHSVPLIIARLAEHCEVHYFGMKTGHSVPELIQQNAVIHLLPFHVKRSSTSDKVVKTILWYLSVPIMAIWCKLKGIKLLYIEESLPLYVPLIRLFFGSRIAIAFADCFEDIYLSHGIAGTVARPLVQIIRWIHVAVWKRLPLIFTMVEYGRKFLISKGVPADRIIAVYNPCDRNIYHPEDRRIARQRFNIPEDSFVIVHHGVLHPNKGNDRIIRALASVKKTLPNIKFLLVGDGPHMQFLKKLVKELEISDTVIFTGWLPTEQDVNWALNTADVGLVMRIGLPSDNFHVTDTLAHEMTCGLPIISARLAGIAEIITDGETGFLFAPDNMAEFETKLLRLAQDSALREKFSRASLELSRRFFDMEKNANTVVERLLKVIEEK